MEDNEKFFKELATKYVEQEGEKLKKELEEIDIEYSQKLDEKIKKQVYKKSGYYKFIPFVAGIILVVFYFNKIPVKQTDIYLKEEAINFLSASIPVNYTINDVEFDNEKTVYYIKNDTNNDIVLITEKTSSIDYDEFKEIYINDKKAYSQFKKDYNLLVYQENDIQYTLSNKFDNRDLIEIINSIQKV